ncbi:MAG TPA: DNA polymerase Y family protein, partial [Rhodocyclaceae bacterium]|nr:DNA polymerase Y family protein [Rhodocyclaceae bacterium]
ALYLPDLALQVFTRGHADATPLALLTPRPHVRVVAANPAAMACGVAPGISRASALALAPGLTFAERDPALEQAALEEIATWAGRFAGTLSLDPPGAVLLEVRGSLRLFGGLPRLAEALLDGLAELGYTGRLGAAATPLAARWQARQGLSPGVGSLTDDQATLDALPLTVLDDASGPGADVLELLAGLGLQRLGALRHLSRHGLARRHAQALTDCLDRAYGRTPDPRPSFVPPERYSARLPLPAPTDQVDMLLFGLRRLLAGLSGWLSARQAGVERFQLVLEYAGTGVETLPVILGKLANDPSRCQLLAREHLTRLLLTAPVEALRLETEAPRPLAPSATDLFDAPSGPRSDPALLLATLRARLGDEAVFTCAPHADHRPEQAWRRGTPRREHAPADVHTPAGPRPLWLLPRPRAVTAPAPERLLAGPERIESGWWDGAGVRRDYYVARRSDDSLVWLFQDLEPPYGWYLHGYFA